VRSKTTSTQEVAVRAVTEIEVRDCPMDVANAIAVVAKLLAVALQKPARAPSVTGDGGRVRVTAAKG
jgi:hypothetical protein